MIIALYNKFDDPVHEIQYILMIELIIDYIIVHTSYYQPDYARQSLYFLPWIMFFNKREHQISIFS